VINNKVKCERLKGCVNVRNVINCLGKIRSKVNVFQVGEQHTTSTVWPAMIPAMVSWIRVSQVLRTVCPVLC